MSEADRGVRGTSDADGQMAFESWIDRQVRMATERGEFDNLPGAGKPLKLRYPDDPNWWIRQKIEDEDLHGILPAPLALRRAKQDLPAKLATVRTESEARRIIAELNEQIKELAANPDPTGPRIIVGLVDVAAALAKWRDGLRETPPPQAG